MPEPKHTCPAPGCTVQVVHAQLACRGLRKVQASELAVKPLGIQVVDHGCDDWVEVSAEVLHAAGVANHRVPLATPAIPRNTLVPAGVGPAKSRVELVLRGRCHAQVRPGVVQPVAVDVVDLLAGGGSQYDSMHTQSRPVGLLNGPRGVKSVRRSVALSVPFVDVQRFEVVRINDGLLALGQRNQTGPRRLRSQRRVLSCGAWLSAVSPVGSLRALTFYLSIPAPIRSRLWSAYRSRDTTKHAQALADAVSFLRSAPMPGKVPEGAEFQPGGRV